MADELAEDDSAVCWCCGDTRSPVVTLGEHPEVAVCLRCAHDLHHRAVAVEDDLRHSLATRTRDVLRSGRRFVMDHDLQHKPVIGPLLQRMGRFMP